jgi:tetratricopeptide (TPR) repeat protein
MQHKFNIIFRRAGVVVFGAVLAAASAAFTAAQEPEPPFAGFASLSLEDQARALEGKTFAELYQAGAALTAQHRLDDAKALFMRALGADCSDSEYAQALGLCLGAMNDPSSRNEATYAEMEQLLDEALQARPNSWRVKAAVAEFYFFFPDFGYMQDGKFLYTRESRSDLLSCQERKRVRQLQLYAEALPLARQEQEGGDPSAALGERLGNDDSDCFIPFDAGEYYIFFASKFRSSDLGAFARQQTLTDLSVLPDCAPVDRRLQNRDEKIAPVDEKGAPVFFAVPESFETAKNDGERRQALLNELLERFPSSKGAVCAARAAEAEALFGIKNLQSYHWTFLNEDYGDEQGSRQEGVWELNTLADNETIAKLPSGVRRIALPPEYAYLDLWREMLELNPADSNTRKKIGYEYQNRRQFDKALAVWKQAAERNELTASFLVSQIADPIVVIDSGSAVTGMNADIFLRYRNAVGAEIVVKQLNVDEPMKFVQTREFWRDYAASSSLTDVVDSVLRVQLMPKDSGRYKWADPKTKKFCSKLDSLDLVGEEVARFAVEFEPSPNHFDKIMRVDFPVDEPGAYLLEVTAVNGNKDFAVVWLRDVAIVRRRSADGSRFFTFDARTGEPLPSQKLEFFAVAQSWTESPNTGAAQPMTDVAPTTKFYSRQTDETGALFFPKVDANRQINELMEEIIVAIPHDGDPAGSTQYAFLAFQGLWIHGVDPVSGYSLGQGSYASIRFDQESYRPGQTAKFKFVVAGSKFDTPAEPMWAGQEVDFRILDKNGRTLRKQKFTLDKFGAASGSFEIPDNASPDKYLVQIGRFYDVEDRFGGYKPMLMLYDNFLIKK